MQVLPTKVKTKRKLHKKVFKRVKESKWGTSCKYRWIKGPWNASEFARTLCLFESTNNIKIKITHKVVGNGCKEYISLMNACLVIQSVFYQVLTAVIGDVFRRKCLMLMEK